MKESKEGTRHPKGKNSKGDKMESEEKKCNLPCYEAGEERDWGKDPEDVLLDLNNMTPEEKKNYLDSLRRNRSLGN